MAGDVAMEKRAGRDHLGVEQRTARELAMERPAILLGPFHHRRHAKSPGRGFFYFSCFIVHLIRVPFGLIRR